MSWDRKDHQAKALPTMGMIIDITPKGSRHAPIPEQDVRDVARRQRNRAQVFSQRDVLAALASAQLALEPKESTLDRASRWLREMMEGGR